MLKPRLVGLTPLDPQILHQDRKSCQKIGPLGLGDRALYLNQWILDRAAYVAYEDLTRAYKRVAMSKGAYTKKGVFATLSYLVLVLTTGKTVVTRLKYETDVDAFLLALKERCPDLPTVYEKTVAPTEGAGVAAEEAGVATEEARTFAEKAVAPTSRETTVSEEDLSPLARKTLLQLRKAKNFLEDDPSWANRLVYRAKEVRRLSQLPQTYYYGGLAVGALALVLTGAGVWGRIHQLTWTLYLILLGASLLVFVIASQVLRTGPFHRARAEAAWEEAVAQMADFLQGFGKGFPLPPTLAHPLVLVWMERTVLSNSANTPAQALQLVMASLQAMDASVTVSEVTYQEVTTIKPLFLVSGAW